VATVVKEPTALPPPAAATVAEAQVVTETISPKRHWSHRAGPARVARTW
jgi:hypothetical protein